MVTRITAVQDLLHWVESNSALKTDATALETPHWYRGHSNLWFRGQSRDNWTLLPQVLRPEFVARAAQTDPGAQHPELSLEASLLDRLRRLGAFLLGGTSSLVDLYFHVQHHGQPTRLLDWTGNPLAALYFAVEEHSDSDGAVFLMPSRMELHGDEENDVLTMDDARLTRTVHAIANRDSGYAFPHAQGAQGAHPKAAP